MTATTVITQASQQFYIIGASAAAAVEIVPHPTEQLRVIGERYKANQDEFSKQLQGWIAQLLKVPAAELEKQAPQLFHDLTIIILKRPIEATKHLFAREVLHCISEWLPRTSEDKMALIPDSQVASERAYQAIDLFIELAQRVAKTVENETTLLVLQKVATGNKAIIAKTQVTIDGIKEQAKEQLDAHKKDTDKKLVQQAAGMQKVAEAFQTQLTVMNGAIGQLKAENVAIRAENTATNATNADLQQQLSSLQAAKKKKSNCVIC